MCAQMCAAHAVFGQKRAQHMKARAHHAYLEDQAYKYRSLTFWGRLQLLLESIPAWQ